MSAATDRERLRIAVQKSGRLAEFSQDLLARCGLGFRRSRDKLFCFGESLAVDLLLVRDDDIPCLIEQGVCDIGIVGRNVLAEYSAARQDGGIVELRALDSAHCRLSIAVPQELSCATVQELNGLRIATSYPALLGAWLAEQGVAAPIVELSGSVEIAPRLGTADAICDLVSSGATLAANQLRETFKVLDSEAVVAGAQSPPADARGELLHLLLGRIDGVVRVRESKLVMLHIDRFGVDRINALLPNPQLPTVTPVEGGNGRVALQAVCDGPVTWQHLEDLRRAGASQLLVLPVEKLLA
ncbi:MAG: ATP phosphoribosyltransferase [Xanthomonadales bacterium PRO7]|nr:ATP phosphoribosyltransferase [Xanthomonadales bacterium PRO7]